ncbi:MAG: DNA primase [Alphaproteobacteria bacterium]
MAFTPEFLDEIRARLSLADVIGRKVRLIKRGREYSALCPFHNEKTPSFTVSEDKGFFHCFGCGAHGDVIAFVMRVDNLSFPDAVERLAADAGLPIPVTTPEERAHAEERVSLYTVTEAACAWFERQLRSQAGGSALRYLHDRGLADDTMARFRLGFAPDRRGALKAAMTAGDFPESLLVAAGLLVAPEDGRAPYDRFRGRIIFPIADRRGRPIAFGGRLLGDGEPKYVNSPETPLFHKGRVLYGLANALKRARAAGTLTVTEGYMDVIALTHAGFASVAPLGTALTESQLRELWRVVAEPILCFDGDAAGMRAAARAAERALPLLQPGRSLRFVTLPRGEDPDSLIAKRGAGAFGELLDAARPLAEIVWEMETTGRPVDTPERRAFIDKRLRDRAGEIADRTVQDYYRRYFEDRVWKEFKARRFAGWKKPQADKGPKVRARPDRLGQGAEGRAEQRERVLVATVLNHPGLLAQIAEDFAALAIASPELDGLRQAIMDIAAANADLDGAGLRLHLTQQGFSQIVDRLAGSGSDVLDWFAKPDADPEDALMGWRHVSARHGRLALKPELNVAEQALAQSMTEENQARFEELKKLVDEGEGDEAELERFGVASGRPESI